MTMQSVVLTLMMGVVFTYGGQRVASAQGQLRIQEMRAMPYYTQTGEVRRSTNLFDPRLALRNIILGSPLEPPVRVADWDVLPGTAVTYVEVIVASDSPKSRIAAGVQLEFVARGAQTRRVLKRESVNLSTLQSEEQRVLYIPFIVYDTGCERLELSARIIGVKGEGIERSGVIPFTCGE